MRLSRSARDGPWTTYEQEHSQKYRSSRTGSARRHSALDRQRRYDALDGILHGRWPPTGGRAVCRRNHLSHCLRRSWGLHCCQTRAGSSLILGFLGFIASTAGAVVMWNKLPSIGPKWYAIVLIVLAIPTAWAGGALRLAQSRPQTY